MSSEIPDFMSKLVVRARVEEIKAMDGYPLPKGTAMALIRLTQREGTSLAVMAHALKSDPTLSVRAIKVANGVGGPEHVPVVSLRDAVNVLGVPAVRSLALGFSLMATYRSGQCGGFDYLRFWSRALARAVALQLLASSREGCPAADAFSVGLLARVGELVLATLFPAPYFDLLQQLSEKPELQAARAEEAAFATTHGVLSASMLLDYNLPEVFAEAVEAFERPESADVQGGSSSAMVRSMLALADHIGGICVADPAEWRALMPKLFHLGSRLSFSAEELIALCDHVAHDWRDWGTLVEIETGPMPHFEEIVAAPVPEPEPEVVTPPMGAGGLIGACALVVGDEARVRKPLCGLMAEAGYRVCEAVDGRQGLAMAIESQPQVMLVDVQTQELDGIELTRTLRQFKAGRSIYVLLLSARDDDATLIQAMAAGGDAFLTLPLKPAVLAAQLQAAQRVASLQEELGRDREEIRRISAELSASRRQLQEVGMTDMLTGCPNRRCAMDRMQQEWAMATRSQRPLACMVIDMDNLKQVNDRYGHVVGDNVLKLVASAFKGELRAQDVLSRSSGDEFMVICPDTTLEAALACAERMRASVGNLPIVDGVQDARGSVSIGVAVRDATTANADALIALADQSAYLAKRRRNAVAAVQSVVASFRR